MSGQGQEKSLGNMKAKRCSLFTDLQEDISPLCINDTRRNHASGLYESYRAYQMFSKPTFPVLTGTPENSVILQQLQLLNCFLSDTQKAIKDVPSLHGLYYSKSQSACKGKKRKNRLKIVRISIFPYILGQKRQL